MRPAFTLAVAREALAGIELMVMGAANLLSFAWILDATRMAACRPRPPREFRLMLADRPYDATPPHAAPRRGAPGRRAIAGLALEVDGASQADLGRGLRAAHVALAGAGVTPLQAAQAIFERETRANAPSAAASAWATARHAAVVACCAGWAEVPIGASLDLAKLSQGQQESNG